MRFLPLEIIFYFCHVRFKFIKILFDEAITHENLEYRNLQSPYPCFSFIFIPSAELQRKNVVSQ